MLLTGYYYEHTTRATIEVHHFFLKFFSSRGEDMSFLTLNTDLENIHQVYPG